MPKQTNIFPLQRSDIDNNKMNERIRRKKRKKNSSYDSAGECTQYAVCKVIK